MICFHKLIILFNYCLFFTEKVKSGKSFIQQVIGNYRTKRSNLHRVPLEINGRNYLVSIIEHFGLNWVSNFLPQIIGANCF